MIKTAIIAKPMEPPFGKTPLKMMPCNSSKTNPNAANIPTSEMVRTAVVVFFINTLLLNKNPQCLAKRGELLNKKYSLR